MDSGTTKHMTLYWASFNTYKIIAICNMHLDDGSIVKTIGMEFIIMVAIVRGNINRIQIKDAVHVPKLQGNLLPVSNLC